MGLDERSVENLAARQRLYTFACPRLSVSLPPGTTADEESLRVCLENGFQVAQATRLCRPATRRTEWKQPFEVMKTPVSQRGSAKFRSAGRRKNCSMQSARAMCQAFASALTARSSRFA